MNVSLHDVHQALVQLGRLRFGEMNIEEAVREIVHTTHAIFSVDGAGLMLVRTGIAGDAADLRADGCGITVAPGIAAGAEPGLPHQLIDPAGPQAEALAQHVQPVLVVKAEQHTAEIDQQHLRAITTHFSTVAARIADSQLAQAARRG